MVTPEGLEPPFSTPFTIKRIEAVIGYEVIKIGVMYESRNRSASFTNLNASVTPTSPL